MSNSCQFVEKVISGEDVLTLEDEATEYLTKGDLSIADLLETLEPYLTNLDHNERGKGVLFLADIFEKLAPDFLNADEVDVIGEYFIGKLNEHFTITPHILKGLSAIVGMGNFGESHVLNLLGSLQMNVTVQTLTQSSRLAYYEILQKLLRNQKEALKKKPNDFVYAIITGMDSEGDPRNLMFLFQFVPEAYSQFPLEHLAEEAFSVLECYFPIDFTQKDNSSITRDDLARGLNDCFVSTSEFGPFALPMVLEKLETALKVAQLDSLKLLISGCDVWNVADISSRVDELWKTLKPHVLQSGDNDVTQLALQAITRILRRFCTSPLSASESETLDNLLKSVTRETHRFLSDPTLTLFLPSTKVLIAVSQASAICCEYVVKTVVPQLLALADGPEKKNDAALVALSHILASSVQRSVWDSDEIADVKAKVAVSLVRLLQEPTTRHGCFTCLVQIGRLLDEKVRAELYDAILDFLASDDRQPLESYSKCLLALAAAYPAEVQRGVVERISLSDSDTIDSKRKKLLTFCWCCEIPSFTSLCCDKLMFFLESRQSPDLVVECMRDFVLSQPSPEVLGRLANDDDLIRRLHDFSCKAEVTPDAAAVGKIVETLMRQLTPDEQKTTCANCLAFYPLDTADEKGFSSSQVQLLKGLLLPLRRDVRFDGRHQIVSALVRSSLRSADRANRESSAILLSSIVNKCSDDETDRVLERIMTTVDDGIDTEIGSNCVDLLAWTVKSLILRNHKSSTNWMRKLVSFIDKEAVSVVAARGFKKILSDRDELSPSNFCSQRLLFKQWVFQWIYDDQLMSLFNEGGESTKKAAALAIINIVLAVPTNLVAAEITKLVKVFVSCLDSGNEEVASATLEVLSSLLSSQNKAFNDYVDTFIPKLLACKSAGSMAVRMNALNCLYFYGKYDEVKLLPYRIKVVCDLVADLDDKKRLVRQKAAKARSRWLLVGAAEG
ncbi:DNA repair transcription protein MET18 MMS19 [Nesidiocoris tenuis]|uniref:MMS19 nucleotide excision repair protein n=1 Tax=Nesidiocoris tenuis TaxID=355587 RepID=A0ABN7BCJ4_9HEMI|nr:DNA repair transcription protein MET18 MMS19 [Nesidiocoris tenuis]